MIRGRCPICTRSFEITKLDALPSFPFCSDRCKLIDLGRWIDGTYTLPGPDVQTLPEGPADGREEDED